MPLVCKVPISKVFMLAVLALHMAVLEIEHISGHLQLVLLRAYQIRQMPVLVMSLPI